MSNLSKYPPSLLHQSPFPVYQRETWKTSNSKQLDECTGSTRETRVKQNGSCIRPAKGSASKLPGNGKDPGGNAGAGYAKTRTWMSDRGKSQCPFLCWGRSRSFLLCLSFTCAPSHAVLKAALAQSSLPAGPRHPRRSSRPASSDSAHLGCQTPTGSVPSRVGPLLRTPGASPGCPLCFRPTGCGSHESTPPLLGFV